MNRYVPSTREMPLQKTKSLAEGLEAVNGLDKHALDEIKCLAKPPEMVIKVMMAVAIIMGKPSKDWNDCKKLFADSKFLQHMKEIDSLPEIKPKQLKKLKKIVEAEEFTVETVTNKSKAAGILCAWVIGVYESAAPAIDSAESDLKKSNPTEWEIFSSLDKDGNGTLDKDELWVKLSSMGDEQATQLIDMVDINGVSASSHRTASLHVTGLTMLSANM